MTILLVVKIFPLKMSFKEIPVTSWMSFKLSSWTPLDKIKEKSDNYSILTLKLNRYIHEKLVPPLVKKDMRNLIPREEKRIMGQINRA